MASSSESPEMFDVRWEPPSFAATYQSAMMEMLERKMLVDVTLYCESYRGYRVDCHQVILAACSPYFAQYFMQHSSTHEKLDVLLQGVEGWQLLAMVSFMYRGEITGISKEQLVELFEVAKRFKIRDLAPGEEAPDTPPSPSESVTTEELDVVTISDSDQEIEPSFQPLLEGSEERQAISESAAEDVNQSVDDKISTTCDDKVVDSAIKQGSGVAPPNGHDAVASTSNAGVGVAAGVRKAKIKKKTVRGTSMKVQLPKGFFQPSNPKGLEKEDLPTHASLNRGSWSKSECPHLAYLKSKEELHQQSPILSRVINERLNDGSSNQHQVIQPPQHPFPYSTPIPVMNYNQELIERITCAATATLRGTPSSLAAAAYGIPEAILNDYLMKQIECYGLGPSRG